MLQSPSLPKDLLVEPVSENAVSRLRALSPGFLTVVVEQSIISYAERRRERERERGREEEEGEKGGESRGY